MHYTDRVQFETEWKYDYKMEIVLTSTYSGNSTDKTTVLSVFCTVSRGEKEKQHSTIASE
jgi:hypothetical protein